MRMGHGTTRAEFKSPRERTVAAALEEGRELVAALLEALLAPLDGHVVHLVDDDHQDAHAVRLREQRVLARLPAALEARLELALPGTDNQHPHVRLARARNHVWYVILVPRGIEYRICVLAN